MGLNVDAREGLGKWVIKFIPQMKKSEIVDHFVKEGLPKSTIYDTINRITTMPISHKKKNQSSFVLDRSKESQAQKASK